MQEHFWGGGLQQIDYVPGVLIQRNYTENKKKCTAPIYVNGEGHDGHPGYFYVGPASYDLHLRLASSPTFSFLIQVHL